MGLWMSGRRITACGPARRRSSSAISKSTARGSVVISGTFRPATSAALWIRGRAKGLVSSGRCTSHPKAAAKISVPVYGSRCGTVSSSSHSTAASCCWYFCQAHSVRSSTRSGWGSGRGGRPSSHRSSSMCRGGSSGSRNCRHRALRCWIFLSASATVASPRADPAAASACLSTPPRRSPQSSGPHVLAVPLIPDLPVENSRRGFSQAAAAGGCPTPGTAPSIWPSPARSRTSPAPPGCSPGPAASPPPRPPP